MLTDPVLSLLLVCLQAFGLVEAGFYDLIKPKGTPSPPLLPDMPHQHKPRLQNVFDVVSSVNGMLPCNKIATSMLMNSCLIPTDNNAVLFEKIGTLYGTRLAVCELFNAHAAIPGPCKRLVPTADLVAKATSNGYLSNRMLNDASFHFGAYDPATALASQKCTEALYSKAQTWTSFSNSKQNSLAICQAMRVEIEKEQLMEKITEARDSYVAIQKTAIVSSDALRELQDIIEKMREEQLDSQMVMMQAASDVNSQFTSMNGDVLALQTNVARTTADLNAANDAALMLARDAAMVLSELSNGFGSIMGDINASRDDIKAVNEGLIVAQSSLLLHQKSIGSLTDETFEALDDIRNMTANLKADHAEITNSPAFQLMTNIWLACSAASYLAIRIMVLLAAAVVIMPVYRYRMGLSVPMAVSCSTAFGLVATVLQDALLRTTEAIIRRDPALQTDLYALALALVMVGYTGGFMLHVWMCDQIVDD